MPEERKRRRSGIPSGNAGEYFVMGELLRRGFDAQLADRNTRGYDVLVGLPGEQTLRKVQVKTVRVQPWYVRPADFSDYPDQVTIYVLLGPEDAKKSVRYFIARNSEVKEHVHGPPGPAWEKTAFMQMKALEKFEDRWDTLQPHTVNAKAPFPA
jgi:hypothetical protein